MAKRETKYETVNIGDVRQGRRGKHHELMQGVLRDLEVLPAGKAIKIPLDGVNGVSLANLRAAINRATSAHDLSVTTYSDGKTLFVWKQDESK